MKKSSQFDKFTNFILTSCVNLKCHLKSLRVTFLYQNNCLKQELLTLWRQRPIMTPALLQYDWPFSSPPRGGLFCFLLMTSSVTNSKIEGCSIEEVVVEKRRKEDGGDWAFDSKYVAVHLASYCMQQRTYCQIIDCLYLPSSFSLLLLLK